MSALIFISTAWGKKYGGINALNSELLKSLPSILPDSDKIFCFCFEADGSSIEEANKSGVKLYQLEKQRNEHENAQFILKNLHEHDEVKVSWWFGHDVTTGFVAKACQEISGLGQLAIFHHMNFKGYSGFKHLNGDIVVDKTQQQREILNAADVVLSVGPKLAESAKSLLFETKHESKVFQIIPGLLEIKPSVQRQPFQAMVVGRLGNDDDIIKQFRLAVAAFGRSIQLYPEAFASDPTIVLFGVPKDEAQETYKSLMELGHKYAQRVVNVIAIPFSEKQNIITEFLRSSWVSLMLSLHEGFGLAGWEAIAAEVPLIISRNSGLFEYIRNEKGGVGTGCIHPVDIEGALGDEYFSENDVKNVSSAIVAIGLRNNEARRDAKLLRENLEGCTWQRAAMELASACSLRSIFIAGEKPGEFVQKILNSSGAFDEHVSRRTIHFEQLFGKINEKPSEINRVILFGGISTMLRDSAAIKNYALWLISNDDAKLFVCYESGLSAESRAKALDENQLDNVDDLPLNALERMKMKEQKVLDLKDSLFKMLGPAVTDRIYFIPLCIPLTNYTMICQNNMYVAPVLHGRSSNTESIRLPDEPSPYRNQFLDYMLFHIEHCNDFNDEQVFINEIEAVKNLS